MLTKIARRLIEHNSSPPVEELRKAAVLLALSDSEDPELLYTLRSSKVSSHGGEVSFPGGMYELEDKSLEHTALNSDSDEIDACFKVPLSFFLEDKRFRNDLIERGDESFFMPAYKYDSFIIWG